MAVQRNMGKSGRHHLEISAFCQACGAKHEFDRSVVGKKAKCLNCGHVFRVPDTREPSPDRLPSPPRLKQPVEEQAPPTPGHAPKRSVKDDVGFDPLEALATSENSSDETAGPASSAKAPQQFGEVDVISSPGTDPQATVTALGVMLGMLYLASIVAGMVLLWAVVGVVVAIWVLLPWVVVHGKKVGKRIIFLLIGRAGAG